MYNDMRAELVISTADGYRLPPQYFQIPMGRAQQEALNMERLHFEVKEIQYQTQIARLERQLDEALKPKVAKWWQRRKKGKGE